MTSTEPLIATAAAGGPISGASDDQPISYQAGRTSSDRIYRGVAVTVAATTLVLIMAIAVFLVVQAWGAVYRRGLWKFLTTEGWSPDVVHGTYGVKGVLLGSIAIALVALALGVPVSVATALAINEYSPRRLRRGMTALIDLLAIIPSLSFGLWGRTYLSGKLKGVSLWLNHHAQFVPLFRTDPSQHKLTQSEFICGVVVAVMIVPVVASVTREVMAQCPRDQCEAAYALGGTRWGMIRDVILPFSRNGIVGGVMLGLGRALGETIAVALIISPDYRTTFRILQPAGGSVASLIAIKFNEAGPNGRQALVAAGLALFVLTLIVNLVARWVVSRSPRGAT